jgi:three-Cys-motif partner protein
MPNHFGTMRHTGGKLDKLEQYLKCFTQVLKNQPFDLIYFDAFAGTPEIDIEGDQNPTLPTLEATAFLAGSSKRALKFGDKFSKYIFVDRKRSNVKELQQLRAEFPDIAERIEIRHSDANNELLDFCRNWPKNRRAVVFLDPYGNQVSWQTVEAIAATQCIDLWYLFPAGLGVYRQISKAGKHEGREESLDRLLGTREWRTAFVETTVSQDLFGQSKCTEKVATPISITEFMIRRMRHIFRGGVLDEWLPLGRGGRHSYSLLFACANPNPKASSLALRLARGVLKSGTNGRAK